MALEIHIGDGGGCSLYFITKSVILCGHILLMPKHSYASREGIPTLCSSRHITWFVVAVM